MASEIQVQVSLIVTKNGITLTPQVNKVQDMAGSKMLENVQQIGTAEEALVTGDIANLGYVLFKNLDPTNFIELGTVAGMATGKFAKLLPGDITLIKSSVALLIYCKANTANCDMLVAAVEL
jgi:hypothetical protein